MVSRQQIPLELTQDEPLPVNDQWGEEVDEVDHRLNRRHIWPVAIGSSVTWVTIAFTFTLINSFVSLDASPDGGSEGLAVGFLWLWFLCLVIGWLWVPAFTRKLPERPSIQEDTKSVGQEAVSNPNFLPNPTPHQSTLSFQPPTGSQLDHNTTANHSAVTLHTAEHTIIPQSSIHPKTDRLFINISNKSGPLYRDELRLAATFNYSRVMRHLALVDDVFKALDKLIRGNGEVGYWRNI